jgi:hypothetical protein
MTETSRLRSQSAPGSVGTARTSSEASSRKTTPKHLTAQEPVRDVREAPGLEGRTSKLEATAARAIGAQGLASTYTGPISNVLSFLDPEDQLSLATVSPATRQAVIGAGSRLGGLLATQDTARRYRRELNELERQIDAAKKIERARIPFKALVQQTLQNEVERLEADFPRDPIALAPAMFDLLLILDSLQDAEELCEWGADRDAFYERAGVELLLYTNPVEAAKVAEQKLSKTPPESDAAGRWTALLVQARELVTGTQEGRAASGPASATLFDGMPEYDEARSVFDFMLPTVLRAENPREECLKWCSMIQMPPARTGFKTPQDRAAYLASVGMSSEHVAKLQSRMRVLVASILAASSAGSTGPSTSAEELQSVD